VVPASFTQAMFFFYIFYFLLLSSDFLQLFYILHQKGSHLSWAHTAEQSNEGTDVQETSGKQHLEKQYEKLTVRVTSIERTAVAIRMISPYCWRINWMGFIIFVSVGGSG